MPTDMSRVLQLLAPVLEFNTVEFQNPTDIEEQTSAVLPRYSEHQIGSRF